MNLVEKLNADLIQAMKEKDKDKLNVLRLVKGAMQLEHINQKKELNDDLAIDVISKQIKSRKESIIEFQKGNRQDLINQTEKEIQLLEPYLPEALSEEELIKIIDQVFLELKPSSIKDMGRVMKEVTPLVKGRADMGMVSKIIRDRLN